MNISLSEVMTHQLVIVQRQHQLSEMWNSSSISGQPDTFHKYLPITLDFMSSLFCYVYSFSSLALGPYRRA